MPVQEQDVNASNLWILPKAEPIITGHHVHGQDTNTGAGKAQDVACPELSAGVADIMQEKRACVETRAPRKDRHKEQASKSWNFKARMQLF